MSPLTFCAVFALMSLNSAWSQDKPAVDGDKPKAPSIWSIFTGPPVRMGTKLGPESYVPVKALKEKNGRVVWVNRDLLREYGIEIPDGPIPDKILEEILDALDYRIPHEGDDPSKFVPGKEQTLYSDRYGGFGQGNNTGSGRAAIAGLFQRKGPGRTPNVSKLTSYDHAHGGASLEEGVREAIWGEVNHHELPHGANRVAILIAADDNTVWKFGLKERRGIIAREDPDRPASYVPVGGLNPQDDVKETADGKLVSDVARSESALKHLADNLPQDQATESAIKAGHILSDEAKIRSGLIEFAKRAGDQFGAAYGRGLFHGAISTSNIDLSGKFLDYGTETSQPGFGPIKFLPYAVPAGRPELQELKDFVLKYLNDSIHTLMPRDLTAHLPTLDELAETMNVAYEKQLHSTILENMGLPKPIIEKLADNEAAQSVSNSFLKLATWDAKEIDITKHMPNKTSVYDMRRVIVALAAHPGADAKGVESIVREEFAKQGNALGTNAAKELTAAVEEFSKQYAQTMTGAEHEAENLGLKKAAYQKYLFEKAKIMNRPLVDLYRPHMYPQDVMLIGEYDLTKDPSHLAESIDKRIHAGVRFAKGTGDFEIPVDTDVKSIPGVEIKKIYDAKNDEYKIVVEGHGANGKYFIGGKTLTTEQLKSLRLRAQNKLVGLKAASVELGEMGHFSFTARYNARDAAPVTIKLVSPKGLWAPTAKLDLTKGTSAKAIDASVIPAQKLTRTAAYAKAAQNFDKILANVDARTGQLKEAKEKAIQQIKSIPTFCIKLFDDFIKSE